MLEDIKNKNNNYNIDYLFYTDNNTDNTVDLLNKYNYNYIEDDFQEKDIDRIKKLSILRQKLLVETIKNNPDYIIMFDTDVFFNGSMIKKALKKINAENIQFSALNTIVYPYPIFYDYAAYSCKFYDVSILFFKSLFSDSIKVKKFFNGVFIIKNKEGLLKNINYITNEPFSCEHDIFNKKLEKHNYDITVLNDITPLYSEKKHFFESKKVDNGTKYFSSYKLVSSNKTDLRYRKITIFIIFVLLILFSYLIFKIILKYL